MAKVRLKHHKHRSMKRRLISGKKPMSAEDKAARKKNAEVQKALNKAKLAKLAKKWYFFEKSSWLGDPWILCRFL